jgi:hypothetical protein
MFVTSVQLFRSSLINSVFIIKRSLLLTKDRFICAVFTIYAVFSILQALITSAEGDQHNVLIN